MMIRSALLEAFDQTVLGGGYNLLLGAGVSLDSRNGLNEFIRSSESLRKDLCALTGAREDTSLSRVYPLLTADQRNAELVKRFSECSPGRSLRYLSKYIWKRIFTFNIDDVIEAHYTKNTATAKQRLVSLNYDAALEPTPKREELQAIHLHGWAQEPTSGFVFSALEYARNMRDMNPWMHLLSEILATEPFIIAGTSLNEIDLEYYLSHRTASTPRRGRGPSLLIEPYPDRVTRSDCERYGLELVEATFGDFLEWLHTRIPAPHSLFELVVPATHDIFGDTVDPRTLLRFFSDFEQVGAGERALSNTPSGFLYGRAPRWTELDEHIDIERQDNGTVTEMLSLAKSGAGTRIMTIIDEPGTGKTTTLRRIAHNFASLGSVVFSLTTLARIDTEAAIACLATTTTPVLLLVDSFADHVDQITDILADPRVAERVIILAAERAYRREYIDLIIGQADRIDVALQPFSNSELQQLIERYRHFGLVGEPEALKNPSLFAAKLEGESVAISICRILNDFRPFDAICDSLWDEASDEHRLAYLCVAISHRCYRGGLRYSTLQSIVGPSGTLIRMLESGVPLRLAESELDPDFVVPSNPVIAERILSRYARRDRKTLKLAFEKLSRAIAPHVNRIAIKRRSPEARLARRLLDFDATVRPLLGSQAEEFYVNIQKDWEWNSRYWEQRALLAADDDIEAGLRHARHAIAVERHQFGLTTLGKLLLKKMELTPELRDEAFDEAFKSLKSAIELESYWNRTTVHPFATLLGGVARYIQLGGQLTFEQNELVDNYAEVADSHFGNDPIIRVAIDRLYED